MSSSLPIGPILQVPPEIYPLLASYLPLQSLSSSLLSLALTHSKIYNYVRPLLYMKLIIKSEEHAFSVLDRILKDEDLGALVRELHVLTDLAVATRTSEDERTVIHALHEVIKTGQLPYMHTLRLVLLPHWYTDEDDDDMDGYDRLTREFWKDLKFNCPRMRALFLQEIGDTETDPWMKNSGLYDLQEFSNFRALGLAFRSGCPREDDGGALQILKSLPTLTLSLHTLSLCLGGSHELATPFLSLTFPHLKSLEIASLSLAEVKDSESMAFWVRHSGLERLLITGNSLWQWFGSEVQPGLLPSLTHLKAGFSDVRAMTSHLPQLQYLSISESKNGQVPYLLRSVLANGLPGLRSLELNQTPYTARDVVDFEGAMWYEMDNGTFAKHPTPRKAGMPMVDGYMHSIVRGAPKLEELCLQGYPLTIAQLKRLAPTLSRLPHLERVYYRAFESNYSDTSSEDVDKFISGCRPLADLCPSLNSVTNVSMTGVYFPYLKGKIIRDDQGTVVEILPGHGFGMELLGGDDDPFPRNPLP